MKNMIYISEPKAIDSNVIKNLVPSTYELIAGSTSFDGVIPSECSVIIMRSATKITPSIKDSFPKLAHIIRVGTGVDNIDMDYCSREGINVYNAPGANADAVSDYVIAMMFMALRKLHLLTPQDAELWNRFKFTGHSVSSRSIGIIGFGNVGKQIFSKLQGFNCSNFIVYDPFVKKEDLPAGVTHAISVEEVLEKSNVVTLHVPLIPTTQYLINKENLTLLQSGSILINASRGGIVNETEVTSFIHEHNLIYIADTVENEPHVATGLLDDPNIIVTPHIASLTEESEAAVLKLAVENFLNDIPMNKIKQ